MPAHPLRLTGLCLSGTLLLTGAAIARTNPFAPIPPGRVVLPTLPRPITGRTGGSTADEPLPPPPPPPGDVVRTPIASPRPAPALAGELERYQLEALLSEQGRLRILLMDRKTGELITTQIGATLPGTAIAVAAASQGSNPSVILRLGARSLRLGL